VSKLLRNSRRSAFAAGASASLLLAMAANSAMAAPTPAPKPTKAAITSNASCPAAPGVSPTAVQVGAIFPRSVAGYSGFDTAAQLRFAQENAKGGINGRKIVLTTYDDAANGATQVTVANKAIQQDNMFGIVAASTTDTMFPTLKNANVPVVGLTNLPPYTTDRNAFGTTGPYLPDYASTSLYQKFKDAGVTSVAIVNHNSPAATSGAAAAAATFPIVGVNVGLRINDLPIGENERKFHWPLGPRPLDHPGLSELGL